MENTEITAQVQETNPKKPVLLPGSIAILVCGIVSIVVLCYFGWIMSIISLVLFNKAKKLYDENPGKYSEQSYKMATSGRTCAIIGLILSIIATVFWIIYFIAIAYALGHYSHYMY